MRVKFVRAPYYIAIARSNKSYSSSGESAGVNQVRYEFFNCNACGILYARNAYCAAAERQNGTNKICARQHYSTIYLQIDRQSILCSCERATATPTTTVTTTTRRQYIARCCIVIMRRAALFSFLHYKIYLLSPSVGVAVNFYEQTISKTKQKRKKNPIAFAVNG